MKIRDVQLHPEFPQKVWVVVEQPQSEPYRIKYDSATDTFQRTTYKTLGHERGSRLASIYGWIGGTGLPPEPHFDVILLTDHDSLPGDIIEGFICGVFLRADGDHKFVAMDGEFAVKVTSPDLSALDPVTVKALRSLYPRVGEGEGWFGAEFAWAYLRENKPLHD